jgi:GT2 family glycosyltransferase
MPYDVSIVLITWADTKLRMDTLKKSMASLKACTKIPHTLVVIDNGPAQQMEFLDSQKIDIHLKPRVNIGVGAGRNMGAAATDSEYIAFVDNDIGYFPKWLKACVATLAKHPQWNFIMTPRKSNPMKYKKHNIGTLGPYQIFNRCSGQVLVMRRSTFETIGQWSTDSKPGGNYCDRARAHGIYYLWSPNWKALHLCKKASYNHRHVLVDGKWMTKKESKKCQSN